MNQNCHCLSKRKAQQRKESASILGTLLIAFIPKCPFCIVAYTSAISTCSTASMSEGIQNWSWWLSLILSAITLLLVIYNFKGTKSLIAIGMILAGSMAILLSKMNSFWFEEIYYTGSVLLLWGVWMNGSFYYFYKKWFRTELRDHPASALVQLPDSPS